MLAVVALAGCVGNRQGVSWPTIGIIELNGEQNIVVSYTDQINIIEPSNGFAAPLVNSSGEVRRDENGDARSWSLVGGDNDGAQFYALPIPLDEDTFLVADYNSRLLEIDIISLSVERVIPLTDHVLADMVLEDGVLYIPLQSSGMIAMTVDDYDTIWTYPTEEGVWAKPLIVDDSLIFTSVDHHMYALDKVSGELQWKVDLEGGVGSTPLLANNKLYIGSYNKKFFEVSLDGEILNSYDTQNWVWGTPAIDENGIAYVTDLSGFVHAVDTNDGLSEVWSKQVATRGIRSGPLLVEGNVVVASRDGFVYWLDRRDGVSVREQEIEGAPELLGDLMFLEPSETLDIDDPLIIISTVNTGELLIAFDVDGNRQSWVYRR